MQKIDLNKTDLPVERTLGMQWNTESDEFIFEVEEKCKPDTRRGILSIVASIYDPMGFISPFMLEGKSILQEMCKRGVLFGHGMTHFLLILCHGGRGGSRTFKI